MSDLFPLEVLSPENRETALEMINQLPVTLLDFALLSNMKNRVYGVHTLCRIDGELDRQWLNACARYKLWQQLFIIQENLMITTGVVLRRTYLRDKIEWHGGSVVTTRFRHAVDENVRQAYTAVGTATLPFTQNTVTLVDNGSFVEATVPAPLVTDPKNVVLRSVATQFTSTIYPIHRPQTNQPGYPYRSGANWVFAMEADVAASAVLFAEDCEFIYVDIAPVVGATIDQIVFMHPSQQQILPHIRYTVVGGNWRFTFYRWTLKRPEVIDEKIDVNSLRPYDFFYDSLPYGTMKEEWVAGVARFRNCATCDNEIGITEIPCILEPVNRAEGQFRVTLIQITDDTVTPPLYKRLCCFPDAVCVPYELEIYYESDPAEFGLYVQGTGSMREGIAAKAAANVKVEDCDCKLIETDYISIQRQELPDVIYVPLNQPVAQYKFGHRRGDQEYESARMNMHFLRRKGTIRQ